MIMHEFSGAKAATFIIKNDVKFHCKIKSITSMLQEFSKANFRTFEIDENKRPSCRYEKNDGGNL